MGDGRNNILNKDAIGDFDGNYGFGKTDSKFPADPFVLNPPYSAKGKGTNFVKNPWNDKQRLCRDYYSKFRRFR